MSNYLNSRKVDSDSIILISTGSSETEVLASELLPIGSSRSHKEEFMRWKKEREAEGMEFSTVFPKSWKQTAIWP